MVVRADPHLIEQAMARHVTTIVAATVQFLLLNPHSWLSKRVLPIEGPEIERVLARLIGTHPADLADGPCPFCEHDECVEGCPVSAARTIVRRQ